MAILLPRDFDWKNVHTFPLPSGDDLEYFLVFALNSCRIPSYVILEKLSAKSVRLIASGDFSLATESTALQRILKTNVPEIMLAKIDRAPLNTQLTQVQLIGFYLS